MFLCRRPCAGGGTGGVPRGSGCAVEVAGQVAADEGTDAAKPLVQAVHKARRSG